MIHFRGDLSGILGLGGREVLTLLVLEWTRSGRGLVTSPVVQQSVTSEVLRGVKHFIEHLHFRIFHYKTSTG